MKLYISTKFQKIIIFIFTFITEIILPYLLIFENEHIKSLKAFSKIDQQAIFLLIFFWIFISYVRGRYSQIKSSNILKNLILEFKELLIVSTFATIVLYFLKIIELNKYFNYKNLPIIFLILISISLLKEIFISILFEKVLLKNSKKVLVIGNQKDIDSLKNVLNNYKHYKRINFELFNFDSEPNIIPDQLIISNDYELDSNDNRVIQYFHLNGVQIFSKSKWVEYELNCIPVNLINTDKFLNSRNFSNYRDFELKIKRLGDIVVSLILIIISSPLVLIAALLIWANDRGPIFYMQIREGMFGKKIKIIKLRSMIIDAENNGAQWAKKNDSRITLIGKLLRKSRIDELPQLISVLKGEMSLIGPRPERPEFNKMLKRKIPYYGMRNLFKPGLSGWAQVNYPYGASLADSNNKLGYDLFYICNYSLHLDLLILFKTMRTVFSGKGSIPN
jgi:exopolysaccharide biosynthesis polyprenyl glycosylphosphotransferase